MKFTVATAVAALFAVGAVATPHRFDKVDRNQVAEFKRSIAAKAPSEGEDMQRANKARSVRTIEYEKLVEALGHGANKARSVPTGEYDKLVEALGHGDNKARHVQLNQRSFPTEQYDKLVGTLSTPGSGEKVRRQDQVVDPIGGAGEIEQ